MRRMRATGIFILSLLSFTASVWTGAFAASELEEDQALTVEVTTPHTDWARPYALGKTRVLFFTDSEGLRPRECVELMQRFDIEGEMVLWTGIVDTPESDWHGRAAGQARMLKLLEQKWNCFVFLELGMLKMSKEAQYKLLQQVAAGAGIVFVGTDDRRVLKDQNRLKELPSFLDVENVDAAYAVGNGRGVRTSQRPFIKYSVGWESEFDHWQERLGRAVLWAAGKEPKANLALTLDNTASGNVVRANLTGALAGKDLKLEIIVKREGEERASFRDTAIAAGSPKEFVLPYLPEGAYYVDGRVTSSAGVETWAVAEFDVKSSRSVAKVTLENSSGEIGDAVNGRVELTGSRLKDEMVRVRLLDHRGRELARKDSIPLESQVPFRFPVESWMPMLVVVDGVLYSAGKEMSHACSFFHVTKRNRGKFNFLMWGSPSGTLAPYAEEALAKTGVTLQLDSGNPPAFAAACGIGWVPYTTRITPFKEIIPDASMKPWGFPFCWNDEKAVESHAAGLAKSHEKAREHGVFAWSLGDEVTTQGACLSEHCQKAYRQYLQEVYRSLDVLNQSWATQFKSWDAVGVTPADPNTDDKTYQSYFRNVTTQLNLAYLWFTDPNIKLEDLKLNKAFYETEEGVAWQQKNYSRWYDRQAFKSWNFAQLCKKYDRAFKAIDPLARTGFEGAGRFRYADDADLIVRSTGFWGPYPDSIDEVIRSIAPRDYPRFNWMGYQKDADTLLGVYWRMVTRGMDTVAWWTWYVLGAYHGWLAPDLRPFPAVKEIVKDTQVMRDGLGDLLLRLEMQDDGIAILYSHPSLYAHKLENGPSYGDSEENHKATHELIRELGLQFRYVTDRMMRLGEFDKSKFKVLLLPSADAVGDKEAAVIEDFVRDGGTVIADVRPGVFNDHCKLRNNGVLDSLFGIKRKGLGEAKVARVTLSNPAFSFDGVRVDSAVDLVEGTAMGTADGAPVAIVRQVGKGKAVLLNFPFSSFPSLKRATPPEGAEAFFRQLFAKAGVEPRLALKDETGKRLQDVEVTRWKDGGAEIVALFRQGGRDQKAELVLPQPLEVYDLRNRKALGRTSSVNTSVLANRASFFVLSPQAALSPALSLESNPATRGKVLKVRISVPGAKCFCAFRIRVTANGQPLEWHDQNLLADQKPVTVEIPIAFNDPPGEYEVTAVDLFTNRASVVKLRMK